MKMNLYIKAAFSLIIVFLFLPISSCVDEENVVPYVPVNLIINLTILNTLTVTGNSMCFSDAGYSGVIVFCEYYDVITPSNSLYHAFDTACTNEVSEDCSIESEVNNNMAICPCCGSEFSLYDGYPISGEASVALKGYTTTVLNNKLYVTN